MKYKELLEENKIQKHGTSKTEIEELIRIAGRDITDSQVKGLSYDRAFATAYNAVLQLCTIIMAVEGFRTRFGPHHKTTFDFVELSGLEKFGKYALYFNKCRQKRNDVDYDRTFVVSRKEKEEIIDTAKEFMAMVKEWLAKKPQMHGK